MEKENSQLTTRLVGFVADDAYLLDKLHQIQVAYYLMASEGTGVLPMEAVNGTGGKGLFMVSGDGRGAVLMVSGMAQLSAPMGYRVWLVRQERQIDAGQVDVDSTGWGSAQVRFQEPILEFDWVGLAAQRTDEGPTPPGNMLLRGRLSSLKTVR